ncbi:unnamed protein product [Clavelina lepadiformis]|uniref:Uncharacterized protein n=1 Tax=Clavelina lepadiformis TaxID=159417 RepID=A0ABP0FZN1_CLALP
MRDEESINLGGVQRRDGLKIRRVVGFRIPLKLMGLGSQNLRWLRCHGLQFLWSWFGFDPVWGVPCSIVTRGFAGGLVRSVGAGDDREV